MVQVDLVLQESNIISKLPDNSEFKGKKKIKKKLKKGLQFE